MIRAAYGPMAILGVVKKINFPSHKRESPQKKKKVEEISKPFTFATPSREGSRRRRLQLFPAIRRPSPVLHSRSASYALPRLRPLRSMQAAAMEGGGVEAPDGVVIDPVRIRPEARVFAWGGGDDGVDDELEDEVCALCGDGGVLIGCEGPCLRFFHATREADDFSGCSTLGFTTAQVQAMDRFICTNCTNKQHRCAGCGVLGSSDAANAQVFRCSHVSCGRFYHPACIGAQLHPENPLEAARCRDQVASCLVFECLRPHPHRRYYDDL